MSSGSNPWPNPGGAALAGAARGRRGRSPRAASPGNSACKHQEQRRALTCLLIWTRFLVHPRQQIFFLSLGNDISQTEGEDRSLRENETCVTLTSRRDKCSVYLFFSHSIAARYSVGYFFCIIEKTKIIFVAVLLITLS